MKTKSLMIAIALMALVMGMTATAQAVTITPIVSLSETGTPTLTTVSAGGTFYLLVNVSDAKGLAGATITITYDATKFEVVGADTTTGLLDYSDIKTDVFTLISPTTGTGDYPWLGNNATVGKLMLSGAYINTTTDPKGGGVVASGAKNIFKIQFKAKTGVTGSGSFTLSPTILSNAAAGYDPATKTEAERTVPVLIGAVDKNHADYNNLTAVNNITPAFPPITYAFASNPVSVGIGASSSNLFLDIDGNSKVEAKDALLLYRYLLGLRGTSLTKNALGTGATRDAAAIAAYIETIKTGTNLDIDGNSKVEAKDALLLYRYLLGLRGTSLTKNALGTGATRDATAIAAYIETLKVKTLV